MSTPKIAPKAPVSAGTVNIAIPVQKRATQTVGLTLLCCAAWYFGVRPLEARAVSDKAATATLTGKVAGGAEVVSGKPQSEQRLLQVTRYVDAATEWTKPAENVTELYDALVQTADELGVRLDRIDPVGSPRTVAGASATAGLSAGATGPQGRRGAIVTGAAGELQRSGYAAEMHGFRLGATGTYQNIVRFVDAVQHHLGATRIGNFRIVASGTDQGSVELSLETWHLKLLAPKAGAAGQGGPGGPGSDIPQGPPPLMPDGGPRP
jgi:hypothetical protein